MKFNSKIEQTSQPQSHCSTSITQLKKTNTVETGCVWWVKCLEFLFTQCRCSSCLPSSSFPQFVLLGEVRESDLRNIGHIYLETSSGRLEVISKKERAGNTITVCDGLGPKHNLYAKLNSIRFRSGQTSAQ